ncbi:MAG: HEPN domain-containing protein [Dehalococcoidia bacterium]|nr:HEPN domain-containing protein [Dehalococcoidia bacterium]MDW8120393.1 HEPN domain-containing protein [Chloroflexota bacterium]
MRPVAKAWLRQSQADWEGAQASAGAGRYEWACFQAQQCAEKALKAFLYQHGRTSILTQALDDLVRECQRIDPTFAQVAEQAHLLALFYITTRYPNALGGHQAPADFFTAQDAQRCLTAAFAILTFVQSKLPQEGA